MASKPFFTEADINSLVPHPLNDKLYGDEPDEELLQSLHEFGILNPIIVAADGETIVSGHRRWAGMKKLGKLTVPIQIRPDLVDDASIRKALIHSNRQRDKTVIQKAREGKELTRIYKDDTTRQGGKRGNVTPFEIEGQEFSGGRGRDAIADYVGMSDKSLRKSMEVVDVIDDLRANGKATEARELEHTLNENVTAAHRRATKRSEPSNRPKEVDQQYDDRTPEEAAAEGLAGMALSIRNFRKQIGEYGQQVGRHTRYQFIMDRLDESQMDMDKWAKSLKK